jgi:phenylalanyl-tRNA synthetase beta chain
MGQRAPTHFTNLTPDDYDEWDIRYLAEISVAAAFPGVPAVLTPGTGATLWQILIEGRSVGSVRRVELDAPPWARPAFGLEINLQAIDQRTVPVTKFREIAVTPSVQVDLALVGTEKVTAAQMRDVIRREGGELLESLLLFDEFRGQGIPEGSRSLAWALTFRHPKRTLQDKEVQGRTEKIVKALEAELGVRQR